MCNDDSNHGKVRIIFKYFSFATAIVSVAALSACSGGGSRAVVPSNLATITRTSGSAAASHDEKTESPNCTFARGTTTCVTTTSTTATVPVGPTCSKTVTTTTTTTTVHHGAPESNGKKLPAPPPTTTTTESAPVCPTHTANFYPLSSSVDLCTGTASQYAALNLPPYGTVTAQDTVTGDVIVTFNMHNANVIPYSVGSATETCVRVLGPLNYDASGNGTFTTVLHGAAGATVGFDVSGLLTGTFVI